MLKKKNTGKNRLEILVWKAYSVNMKILYRGNMYRKPEYAKNSPLIYESVS